MFEKLEELKEYTALAAEKIEETLAAGEAVDSRSIQNYKNRIISHAQKAEKILKDFSKKRMKISPKLQAFEDYFNEVKKKYNLQDESQAE